MVQSDEITVCNVLLTINNWRGNFSNYFLKEKKMLFLISYILLNYLQKGRKFSHLMQAAKAELNQFLLYQSEKNHTFRQ